MTSLTFRIRGLAAFIRRYLDGASQRYAFEALRRSGLIEQGRHVYGIPTVHVYRGNASRLKIGCFVSIAGSVDIFLGGNHPTEWITTYPLRAKLGLPGAFADGMPSTKGDVEIGNDVWIGHGSTILSGVTIGDGSVIAAGSLVTKDVAPYSLVAGIPGRCLRKRFTEEQIAALLDIAWWNWCDLDISKAVDSLCTSKIDAFLEEYARRTLTIE